MFDKRPFSPFSMLWAVLAIFAAHAPIPLSAQDITLDPAFLEGYSWRNLGPDRGGRSIAVSGVVGRPQEAYFGAEPSPLLDRFRKQIPAGAKVLDLGVGQGR